MISLFHCQRRKMKVTHAKMNQMSQTIDNATTLSHMVTRRSCDRLR